MFERKVQKILYEYYERKDDPILILTGARQIGKTFIIEHTAKKAFKNFVEINLKDDELEGKIFSGSYGIDTFYYKLSSVCGDNLGSYDDTIVFLDEIQTYPHLISMLKSLSIDRKYRFICSGSLLGVTMKHIFIPIGYIQEVKMYPMDFEEFMMARGCGKESIDYLRDCFKSVSPIDEGVHRIFLQRFREYLICGGLPAAVKRFVDDKNVFKTRELHNMIYSGYQDDASKYDIEKSLKIRTIFDSLPSYMENKVKRINIRSIEGDKRAVLNKYADEFDYLIYSGSVIPVKAVSDPKFPLLESSSKNLIKLYYNDVGLLTNVLYKNNIVPLLNNDKYVNLGSVYESVCAMELKAHGHDLYYFDSKKVGEVDFLLNDYDRLTVSAIEIKSGDDQNNFRALPKLLKEPYNLKVGYVFGNNNIVKREGNIITFPIYMIMFV